MNEEELLREAEAMGTENGEELTFGELCRAVELGELRQRRYLQQLALIAYRHAVLTARALSGQALPALEEAFPFWTEEELSDLRLHRYREMMERLAGKEKGETEQNGK